MTSKYVPFLKLKPNEIMAVKELDADLRQALTPFFDFPYKKVRTEEDFKKTAEKRFRSIVKHLSDIPYFYLDNYDVDSNLAVDGGHNYAYLLSTYADLPVVPVISIDRDPGHMQAVCEAKDSGDLKSETVALRFIAEHFENFDVVAVDIEGSLSYTFQKFNSIDLILDCRVSLNQDAVLLTSSIALLILWKSEMLTLIEQHNKSTKNNSRRLLAQLISRSKKKVELSNNISSVLLSRHYQTSS